MKWTSGALAALARGFWNRLLGLLADDSAGIQSVQRLASSQPTNVSISEFEAQTLHDAGKAAQLAASRWYDDIELSGLDIPKIPGPVFNNIDGSEPGKYNFGLIINDPQNIGNSLPVQFSTDRIPTVNEVLEMLNEFIANECLDPKRRSWGDCRDAQDIFREAISGGRDWIIPWQLWERIESYGN